MSVELHVYDSDLVTSIATLDRFTGLGWSHEVEDFGAGRFTVSHLDATVQANPSILDGENLVQVNIDGTDRFAFVIRSRKRTAGSGFDAIEVVGPDAVALMARALVYPPQGLDALLQDERLFAWQSIDYEVGAGWATPTSLGTYANPTDAALAPAPGDPAIDEVQTVTLNADTSGFPWGDGSTYPSPGGLPGTWTLTHRGKTTAALAHDCSLAQIEAALEALPHIDGVTVGGTGPTSSFTVTFDGPNLTGQAQEMLTLNHSQLRHGTSSVVRTTAGTEAVEGESIVEGWPDSQAQWLGGFGVLSHYRRVIDVEAAGKSGRARLFAVTIGTEISVWLDGDHLGDGGKLDLLEWDLDLYEIDHVIAARANGPMMLTILRLNDDGTLGGVLYRFISGSGDPFDLEVYGPDEPPGVTPGFMLETLFDEAAARGFLPPISVDFDATTDSLGNAWTIDVELGVQVGNDSVLSVAERLRDLGVYVEMTPALVFRVWEGHRVDRGGTPDGGATTVTFPADEITDLTLETEDEEITALLMRLTDTWVERHQAGPRREAFLSLGTVPTVRGAQAIAERLLDDLTVPRKVVKWRSTDGQTGLPQPYDDLDVGDVVQAPHVATISAASWSATDVHVVTIAADVDEGGQISWRWEGVPT